MNLLGLGMEQIRLIPYPNAKVIAIYIADLHIVSIASCCFVLRFQWGINARFAQKKPVFAGLSDKVDSKLRGE